MPIIVSNNGPAIIETNYFHSDLAARGMFYVTINAGVFRLLIPPVHQTMLLEFRTAKDIIISRGPWPEAGRRDAIEILLDDKSDNPFAFHLDVGQLDRLPLPGDVGEHDFSAWIADKQGIACVYRSKCWYRLVKQLPCLEPR